MGLKETLRKLVNDTVDNKLIKGFDVADSVTFTRVLPTVGNEYDVTTGKPNQNTNDHTMNAIVIEYKTWEIANSQGRIANDDMKFIFTPRDFDINAGGTVTIAGTTATFTTEQPNAEKDDLINYTVAGVSYEAYIQSIGTPDIVFTVSANSDGTGTPTAAGAGSAVNSIRFVPKIGDLIVWLTRDFRVERFDIKPAAEPLEYIVQGRAA